MLELAPPRLALTSIAPEALAALVAIERDDVELVHVPRPIGPELTWLAAHAPPVAGAVHVDRDAVAEGARTWTWPEPWSALAEPLVRQIRADLAALVPPFLDAVRRRHARVELATVESDACRKFHADYVALRLLVSYAGPGTEWLPSEHVRREWIGRSDVDFATANARIVATPSAVRRAEPGDVLILKGEAFRDRDGRERLGRGAVHRSPSIEGTGQRRLVLKLDVAQCGT